MANFANEEMLYSVAAQSVYLERPKLMLWNLLWLVIGVALLAVVVIAILAAIKRSDFRIARTVQIQAPADRIYPHIISLKSFHQWSPFAGLDPNMQVDFSGPEQGIGCQQKWSGNNKAGEGCLKVTNCVPPTKVMMDLSFTRPMKCQNKVEFLCEPQGAHTLVTWAMTGTNPFMARVFDVLMNFDKMVGKDFERGLNTLKQRVENQST